jgi:phenylacetate-CoA ligase
VARHLFYYPLQWLRGQAVRSFRRQVARRDQMAAAALVALRDRQVGDIVRFAYESCAFYRQRFDRCGVTPADIQSKEALRLLPVLGKREILEHERDLTCPRPGKRITIRKTGGSTGMTLHFAKDADALALNDAIMYRCYGWYGIEIGDRQARFWGVPVTAGLRWRERLKDFALNRIRISAFDISDESSRRAYERIRKFRPAYFYGYTTAIYGFCLFMKRQGIDLNSLNLKAVICTAEKMHAHHRALFAEMFRCPVVDEYGSSENGIIAFQCREGKMHLMEDHLCVEFLDEAGNPVKAGELGRIVITDPASFAMPLIRYDIGDMGRPTDETCRCGVTLPVMEMVEGRREDFITTRSGKLVHAAYLCYTLKDDAVHEFKMYQTGQDALRVVIVKGQTYGSDTEARLERKLRTELGSDVAIRFEYVERIPREASGKLRYFVSEIGDRGGGSPSDEGGRESAHGAAGGESA